jgi:hypothetical protein
MQLVKKNKYTLRLIEIIISSDLGIFSRFPYLGKRTGYIDNKKTSYGTKKEQKLRDKSIV